MKRIIALVCFVLVGCSTSSGGFREVGAAISRFSDGYHRASDDDSTYSRPGFKGGKVYNSDECTGAIVSGMCHGSITPKAAYYPTCHGAWVGDACTGPMF